MYKTGSGSSPLTSPAITSNSPTLHTDDMASGGFMGLLAHLDVFHKVEDAYQSRTKVGGLTTAVVGTLLLVLVVSELAAFRADHVEHDFVVDTTAHIPLQVNLDVVVGLECKYITMLLLDHSGAVSMDMAQRLNLQPEFLDVHTLGPAGEGSFVPQQIDSALVRKRIRDANKGRHVPTVLGIAGGDDGAPGDNNVPPVPPFYKRDGSVLPGCRLKGAFNINKVAGRLQIMAQGHGQGIVHTPHEGQCSVVPLVFFFLATIKKKKKNYTAVLNFTHRINQLSFGADFPGIVNPLDGHVEVSRKAFQMYQYFVSVVPTIYTDASDNKLYTNQYAVREYAREVDHEKGSHGIPGIIIMFDMEPLLVRVTDSSRSFLHLLVRLCGVVGGIFVCTGKTNGEDFFFFFLLYDPFFKIYFQVLSRAASIGSSPASPAKNSKRVWSKPVKE